MPSLDTVRVEIAACHLCPLGASTYPVPGWGNPHSRLMFVGMEPGNEEEVKGIPFVGRSGKYLDTVLRLYRHDLEDFYRTNVVRCRPRNPNKSPRNASWTEVHACASHTEAEIRAVDPDVIVLMGFTALPLAFPGLDPGKANGLVRAFDLFGRVRVCVGCYHPAAVLRQRGLAQPFAQAIRTALEVCNV